MARDSTGVWYTTESGDLLGKYYMYKVTFADGTTNYAVDPYARAVSANGQRTAIVDLAKTNTALFIDSKKPPIIDAADAIIYELHVRDFSIDSEAPFENKGEFSAFTETDLKTANGNSVGIDHLKELGVTHVHLLPSYDYASVNELSDQAQFNWGYDPQNYNVPEGSYSSDATVPTARIEEFKNMVAAMHNAGIRVVMDVVYNHTYSIEDGPFNKVVPNYFYRTNDDGTYANGSGCGNEIASERPMVRKYITDSVKYWADEYDLDGFRFDLMGLIDTQTMRELTNELRTEFDPDMLIYGEPWQAGGSILPGAQQTIKGSQKGEDFKVFNDEIRGAIKGDSDSSGKGFATGAPNKEDDIIIGVKGAIDTIAQEPTEVISYVTAHDNLNLWDKVIATQELEEALGFKELKDGNLIEGGNVAEMVANAQPYKFVGNNIFANETVRRSILANGIALTSQGIPFIHAGEEILRTKYGDHNSYKSPDEINMIRWETKDQFEPIFDYYAGLIELRKNHPAFTMDSAGEVNRHFKEFKSDDNIVGYTLSEYANGDNYKNIAVIYNANTIPKQVILPSVADWKVVVNDVRAGTEVLGVFNNTNVVTVAPLSMMVLYDDERQYQPVATTINVSEDFVGLGLNDSHVFDVTIRDQYGVEMNVAPIITTSNNEIIKIDGQKIIGSALGDTSLTFKAGEASAIVDVEVVNELIPNSVEIIAPKPSVYVDFNLSLTANVRDQFNQLMDGQHVNWKSDNPKFATIGVDGTVIGVTQGNATITATVDNVESALELKVIPYEKRYIQLEYFRPAGDYEGWNLWVWNTGAKNDRIDFITTADGKKVANIEIGPTTESIGFIIRQSINGNDWAQKDIESDRSLYAPKDQTITKVKVNQGQIAIETID
ncbi:type I pullulanase [Epulopiscium sp. SCG-B10WGA-EpuloA2]|nr:type I pullulanase [Epulopiscium sp. SCG-B10WGA-EpuloA2]